MPSKEMVVGMALPAMRGQQGSRTMYFCLPRNTVLARRFSVDPEMVSRFEAEARAVNQIRHRHIIDIFSFGQLPDGRQYYVMEYLDGQPLDQQ